ncbi:hypothetical protein [Vibrio mediterranei]|uniref:hypothetical protein n=1 Tax=Vibrio mediterranei TaxID=689 RepID=UPI004067A621
MFIDGDSPSILGLESVPRGRYGISTYKGILAVRNKAKSAYKLITHHNLKFRYLLVPDDSRWLVVPYEEPEVYVLGNTADLDLSAANQYFQALVMGYVAGQQQTEHVSTRASKQLNKMINRLEH